MRSYLTITKDLSRVMTRVKAIYRSWAIRAAARRSTACAIEPRGSRKSVNLGCVDAEIYYQELEGLRSLRQQVRKDVLAESKKHQVWKRLRGIPSIGPIRAAVLLGILQTAHRFRTKRQLWTYSGFGVEGHSSADHQVVNGKLQRRKKPIEIHGLNKNCNHHLKSLCKSAAINTSTKPGPLQDFYATLVAKGMRPEMARLTLASHHRSDRVEERSVLRRQTSETTNSLSVSDRVRSMRGIFSSGGRRVLETLWFESKSQVTP